VTYTGTFSSCAGVMCPGSRLVIFFVHFFFLYLYVVSVQGDFPPFFVSLFFFPPMVHTPLRNPHFDFSSCPLTVYPLFSPRVLRPVICPISGLYLPPSLLLMFQVLPRRTPSVMFFFFHLIAWGSFLFSPLLYHELPFPFTTPFLQHSSKKIHFPAGPFLNY